MNHRSPAFVQSLYDNAKDDGVRIGLGQALGITSPLTLPPSVIAATKGKEKGSIRFPRRRKMSQAEQEYGAILRSLYPDAIVAYEAMTIILTGGHKYTFDWLVTRGRELVGCIEVKGEKRLPSADASYRALKTAVGMFPDWPWMLAEKRDGKWIITKPEPEAEPAKS